jgi:hypothetical protein
LLTFGVDLWDSVRRLTALMHILKKIYKSFLFWKWTRSLEKSRDEEIRNRAVISDDDWVLTEVDYPWTGGRLVCVGDELSGVVDWGLIEC